MYVHVLSSNPICLWRVAFLASHLATAWVETCHRLSQVDGKSAQLQPTAVGSWQMCRCGILTYAMSICIICILYTVYYVYT